MDNQSNIPRFMQSSVDPNQISTTIESAGKILAGTVAFIAVLKGVDPAIANQQWGNFVQLVATGAPAAYITWHSAEMVFGLLRKFVMWLSAKKPAVPPPAI